MNEEIEIESDALETPTPAFHLWATHYYKCKRDFVSPSAFSAIPYYLLCRAIEFELKSRHLQQQSRIVIKYNYGHNIIKLYEALSDADKMLSAEECEELAVASKIYNAKGFEQAEADSAENGFTDFPDLDILDVVAAKLLRSTPMSAV